MILSLSWQLWRRKTDKIFFLTKSSFVRIRFYSTHYDTLKVKKDASIKEIKIAYVELSKKVHPDLNKNNPDSQRQFIALTEAYKVLSNSDSKSKYDLEQRRQHVTHQSYANYKRSNTNYNAGEGFQGFGSSTGSYKYRVRYTKKKAHKNYYYEEKASYKEEVETKDAKYFIYQILNMICIALPVLFTLKIIASFMELLAIASHRMEMNVKRRREEVRLKRSVLQARKYISEAERRKNV